MAKVLIVDDEEAILMMYGDRLKAAGYEIDTAGGGESAIEKAKKGKPDLILLDIIMPKINGLDVLKQLKSHPETKCIPVFLLTNLPEDSTGDKAKEFGADDYLVKAQVEPGQLVDVIKTTLSGDKDKKETK